jgi:hypothetical protein
MALEFMRSSLESVAHDDVRLGICNVACSSKRTIIQDNTLLWGRRCDQLPDSCPRVNDGVGERPDIMRRGFNHHGNLGAILARTFAVTPASDTV